MGAWSLLPVTQGCIIGANRFRSNENPHRQRVTLLRLLPRKDIQRLPMICHRHRCLQAAIAKTREDVLAALDCPVIHGTLPDLKCLTLESHPTHTDLAFEDVMTFLPADESGRELDGALQELRQTLI